MNRVLAILPLLSMSLAAPSQTLASFVDNHRVLLVFAPAQDDARFQQQLTLLQHHAAEMDDRDLVLLPVLTQQPARPSTSDARHLAAMSAREQLATRLRFHMAASAFAVILLGKDGGEKLRSPQPITIHQLNRTIDAMPMRRQEMQNRNSNP